METATNTDPYPMTPLRAGETIHPTSMAHSVDVLSCTLMHESTSHSYAHWLVLCHRGGNLHPFVVWNAYDRPNGWSLEGGTYCETIDGALKRYRERGGLD